jgi:prepilin-type processing-associated H-X9-DG protein
MIGDITQHVEEPGLEARKFHQGKFNYLFVDGHVEWLSPVKTLGVNSPHPLPTSGMWTVNPND